MHYAVCPRRRKTHRPPTVSRTATLFVFPVTIKSSRLIEGFRCDCGLIGLLLCCGKAAIPTEKCKRYSNSIKVLYRLWWLQQISAPRFQDNRHMKVVSLSVPLTCRLYLQEIFLVLNSVRCSVNQRTIGRTEGLINQNSTITQLGIEPTCSPHFPNKLFTSPATIPARP